MIASDGHRQLQSPQLLDFRFVFPFDDFVLAQDDVLDVGQILHAMFENIKGSVGEEVLWKI